VPLVVWLALRQAPARDQAATSPVHAEEELMGIPVRHDLKLPAE
jgi:hypothetical protein